MIKNILAVGDSFTYGEELNSRDEAYPIKLGELLGASVINEARPGSGNKRMIRNVISHVAQGNPVDLVVIGWTSAGRMEFADMAGVYDLWPGYAGDLVGKADGYNWRTEMLRYINQYHDPAYLYQQYLLDIILMQSFLKTQGIRYVMTRIGSNEYYHNTYKHKFKSLTDKIDTEDFIGWPNDGMTEWTLGCPLGPNNHFLEAGHLVVANKIYEHIRNRGWVS